jgi:pimeloyl-ACP methyl ester carboxylesterase
MHWILIRGLQREQGHFGDFGRDFAAAFPDATVSYLDLPGAGENHRGRAPFSVRKMVEMLRAQSSERGLQKPYLLGLSLGGMVAAEWAHRYPDELSGIVLINTSFGGYSPPWHRFSSLAMKTAMKLMRERDVLVRERHMTALGSNRPELLESTAARWAGIARARPVSRSNALRQLFAAATYRPTRRPPSVPHLLVVARGDRICDPRCTDAIAEVWGSRVAAHPSGGHDLTLDDAPWVVGEISAWLEAIKVR